IHLKIMANTLKFKIQAIAQFLILVQISFAQNLNVLDSSSLNQTLKTVTISTQNPNFQISNNTILTEVYPVQFFNSNPSPTLFENLQQINGLRPQINCNICNTGDIHINGLEGPYSLILIDGMPIVSGLSTVYGFHGIPKSIIQSIEVVKGPSSTLYG